MAIGRGIQRVRDAFEDWRSKKWRVLRTAQDWEDFLRYKRRAGAEGRSRRAQQQATTDRAALPAVPMRTDCSAFPDGTRRRRGVRQSLGWPTTVQNVKDAKRRGKAQAKSDQRDQRCRMGFPDEGREAMAWLRALSLTQTWDRAVRPPGECRANPRKVARGPPPRRQAPP